MQPAQVGPQIAGPGHLRAGPAAEGSRWLMQSSARKRLVSKTNRAPEGATAEPGDDGGRDGTLGPLCGLMMKGHHFDLGTKCYSSSAKTTSTIRNRREIGTSWNRSA